MNRTEANSPDSHSLPRVEETPFPGWCQPAADAACGRCRECREEQARRFDALLAAQLETIRRGARLS